MFGALWWLGWGIAVGAGWLAASAGPAVGVATGLVGAVLTWVLQRRGWARPLERLRERLEAASRGAVLPPESGGPPTGRWASVFAAAERLERAVAAESSDAGDPWGAAALRLDAQGTVADPAPLDARFEAALERLLEREHRRASDLHRAAADVAGGGVAVVEALERAGARWGQLAERAEAWDERADEAVRRIEAEVDAIAATRAALDERRGALAESERRLESSLRAAAAALARVAALERDLDAGGRDLEQLERLVAGLGRASEPERRLEWVGEARATLAHWTEARASWAAEASRARDQLAALADAVPGASRGPDVDGALEGGLAELAQLTRAWSDYASSLRTLASSAADEASERRDDEARLRRGLAALALVDTAELSRAAEDALLDRLRLERAARSRAESSDAGVTEETRRLLQQIEARGARARQRLDDLAKVLSEPGRGQGAEVGRDPG